MDIPREQNKFRKRLIRALVGGGALAVLGLITLGVSRLKPADPSVEKNTIVVDTVKRGPMLREVRGYGTLVPEEMHWIPATTDGKVERILVHPGTTVRPDTILLEMSNPQLENDAANAEMEVKAAEADYTSLRVQLAKEVLDERSSLATVESDYSQAALQAQLNEQLSKEGLISDLDLKISQTKAKELTTKHDIEVERLKINTESVDAQLAAKQAHINQQRDLARLKQSQLDALHVRAGTSGVLAVMPVDVGQQVTPGTNLARVADPRKLKAQVKIPETQAKDVQIGQPATVDTHNGVVQGQVSRIDPTVQDGSVTVDVAFTADLPQGARQDLSVDGTIELERLANVLYVGRPAFGQEKSLVGLFRLENGGIKASRIQVKFGRESVNAVEIVEGLKEGDEVIISDMSAWDSFEHVRLE